MLLVNNRDYTDTDRGNLGESSDKSLSLGLMEELRRKIATIDTDYKTIACGIASRDRKQYIGMPNFQELLEAHDAGIISTNLTF